MRDLAVSNWFHDIWSRKFIYIQTNHTILSFTWLIYINGTHCLVSFHSQVMRIIVTYRFPFERRCVGIVHWMQYTSFIIEFPKMKFRAFLDICSWIWGGRMWMDLEMNVKYMLGFVKKTLQAKSYEKWNDMVTNWKYSS